MGLVTIREAADALGVSPYVLRQEIRAGSIPAYSFGPRSVRVDLDEALRASRMNTPEMERHAEPASA